MSWAGGPSTAAADAAAGQALVSTNAPLTFLRSDHHNHLPPFHERLLLDAAVFLQVVLDAFQQLGTELLVSHLAAAETKRDLRLVAVRQELDQVLQLDLVVTFLGAGSKLDLLDLNLLLLASRGLSLLVLLEHEF